MKAEKLNKIHLVWRKSRGDSRIVVGCIKRTSSGNYIFKYLMDGVRKAMKFGFTYYPDFPDIDRIYTDKVLDIFGQRLNNNERSDIYSYYNFWEIDPKDKNDKFYILAQTQGLLSTDNFEFLAEYYLKKDLKFISEISGIKYYDVASDELSVNDNLTWRLDPQNQYDKYAVQILKNKKIIGYVKLIHSIVFHDKRASRLAVRVKSLEKNGHISRAFIQVYNKS